MTGSYHRFWVKWFKKIIIPFGLLCYFRTIVFFVNFKILCSKSSNNYGLIDFMYNTVMKVCAAFCCVYPMLRDMICVCSAPKCPYEEQWVYISLDVYVAKWTFVTKQSWWNNTRLMVNKGADKQCKSWSRACSHTRRLRRVKEVHV